MSIDRLSNMVSALKNASMAKRDSIEIFHTKECEAVAKVLKKAGFLAEVKTFKPEKSSFKMLHLELAKDEDEVLMITDTKRVSKPGRRIYKNSKELKPIANGYGIAVVSTNRGIMSGEEAKKKKLGGEVICEVR